MKLTNLSGIKIVISYLWVTEKETQEGCLKSYLFFSLTLRPDHSFLVFYNFLCPHQLPFSPDPPSPPSASRKDQGSQGHNKTQAQNHSSRAWKHNS